MRITVKTPKRMSKFWYHSFLLGQFQEKTLLVNVEEINGPPLKLHVGWMRTEKFRKLDKLEKERFYSWGKPPQIIYDTVWMWWNSPFRDGMSPTDFVVKTLGVKQHWTEWDKND